jgi:ABC-type uncharacterized transport system ATPase component
LAIEATLCHLGQAQPQLFLDSHVAKGKPKREGMRVNKTPIMIKKKKLQLVM